MKKSLIIGALLLIIGIVAGWLCREHHFRGATKMVQRDTIVRFDTIRYSRLELVSNTYKLELPRISRIEFVFVPEDSVSYIYRDSIRYVTLPRQFFYTKTKDAEIWHSGIDSRIDSLNVFRESKLVREVVSQSVTNCHELSIGIEADYSTYLSMPIQIQYSRRVRPWFSVYGYAEYELVRKQFGVGIGTQISVGW